MQTPTTNRIYSIDILRGIIMVIMALDHVRDFFSNVHYDPLDLTQTTPQLFLTRWITHYCAPIFVFLSGASAFLSFNKKGSKKEASIFLLKRGLWLLFIEIIVINLSWSFDIYYTVLLGQVIWAIGWSMIFLAAFIWLPIPYIAGIGLSMILLHNSLDGVKTESFGSAYWLWMVLHNGGFIATGKTSGIIVGYPLIPWIGVMATGYAFGTIFKQDVAKRKKQLLQIGMACIVLFIVVRFSNVYGDRNLWVKHDVWWKTILSFVDCTKYPPSLLYLLMTIGLAMIALYLFENVNNTISQFFTVFGRVPFFYYLLHVPLIHTLAIIVAAVNGNDLSKFTQSIFFTEPDPAWGFGLPVVYLVWIVVVLALYFPCKWFMKVKARRKDWWLSYL